MPPHFIQLVPFSVDRWEIDLIEAPCRHSFDFSVNTTYRREPTANRSFSIIHSGDADSGILLT